MRISLPFIPRAHSSYHRDGQKHCAMRQPDGMWNLTCCAHPLKQLYSVLLRHLKSVCFLLSSWTTEVTLSLRCSCLSLPLSAGTSVGFPWSDASGDFTFLGILLFVHRDIMWTPTEDEKIGVGECISDVCVFIRGTLCVLCTGSDLIRHWTSSWAVQ